MPAIVNATGQGSAVNPNHARKGPSTTAAASAPSEAATSWHAVARYPGCAAARFRLARPPAAFEPDQQSDAEGERDAREYIRDIHVSAKRLRLWNAIVIAKAEGISRS